ncbi:conserved hypothetical protein [Histoplasma capsulatum var. duboisii H88]|uniref:PPPDE domain-containing protein n=1 Tax=Ajellomyces capsulatus (strain H88) TaxID=544711 RepID=F0UHM2_AJEC8|nr:conserved hypothetical protein [Histoplasma capsulatum var. duboisii H88]
MADPNGTLVRIGINGCDAKSGGGDVELLINQFQLSRSSAKSVVPLVGSHATCGEVEDAARACFESFNYNILLDNCQTFTIDVLTELRRRFPSRIQQASISLIREQYGTTPVKIQQFLDGNKQQSTKGHHPKFRATIPS